VETNSGRAEACEECSGSLVRDNETSTGEERVTLESRVNLYPRLNDINSCTSMS
jgi:hypothetical protein